MWLLFLPQPTLVSLPVLCQVPVGSYRPVSTSEALDPSLARWWRNQGQPSFLRAGKAPGDQIRWFLARTMKWEISGRVWPQEVCESQGQSHLGVSERPYRLLLCLQPSGGEAVCLPPLVEMPLFRVLHQPNLRLKWVGQVEQPGQAAKERKFTKNKEKTHICKIQLLGEEDDSLNREIVHIMRLRSGISQTVNWRQG